MVHGDIEVQGVWKKFRRGELHSSLRDAIPAAAKWLFKRNVRQDIRDKEFWALRDVSFQVSPGESLGIIGSNGAGKSTILKVLTKILRPTRGRYRVKGRVGALVEIAAGFHPDLTGRENMFLQGAIMGMSNSEVHKKFEQIVGFADIGEFIDTPVKRYSSGMHARLGFSIVAHLDPDVLIIDEILAVGDLAFQVKAFERIRELATSGIPVIVVSHQLPRIAEICTKAVLLDHGEVLHAGSPADCIALYTGRAVHVHGTGVSNSPVELESVEMARGDMIRSGEVVCLTVKGRLLDADIPDHVEPVAVALRDVEMGQTLYLSGTRDAGLPLSDPGPFSIDVDIQMNVRPGLYSLETYAWDMRAESAVFVGPRASILVHEGPPFVGYVQLNAGMQHSHNDGPRAGD